ncbi:hypothetical protein FLK61_25495 [Paenalkalicoccus suaedae]|uniref:Uncharacterized protein n=1 Tax=Paenalkalicoccus suaedae TaxID=2592382 RepID=A0A859FBC8_9BACI|nr:hypothetical protein [Paenalkalicoccus suaedae]QKS70128.1 hypothetical protein FLK61_25495 [Paenalkalicoccus suaedae]
MYGEQGAVNSERGAINNEVGAINKEEVTINRETAAVNNKLRLTLINGASPICLPARPFIHIKED